MSNDLKRKTAETAELYFRGFSGERPYELWRSFDKDLAKELSIFVTGQMYSRQVIPHRIRQLITVSALTVLERTEELEMHICAALNVGCTPREIAEVIFQTAIYGGFPAMNNGLKTLKKVLEERGMWPLKE